MLIFEKAPFPSCHASTLVEVTPGRFLAAWFGGKAEGAKDVQIWASEYDGKAWTPPQVLATEPGQPCWNPVLFVTPKKDLVLWYKAGPSPREWTGYVKRSTDHGKTWSKPEQLPAGFYGPVRAKPIISEKVILAPTSVESYKAWTPFVDHSDDEGRSWLRSYSFGVTGKPHGQIQPTLFESNSGTLVALMRSRDPKAICRSESRDGGVTWSAAVLIMEPNPNAGIDAVKAKDAVYLIHNPSTTLRTPLRISKSTDDGRNFEKVKDLETEAGEYSYPAMILGSDGQLHCTYTWNRTHIKYETLKIQ